jgi:hypothetical protein
MAFGRRTRVNLSEAIRVEMFQKADLKFRQCESEFDSDNFPLPERERLRLR